MVDVLAPVKAVGRAADVFGSEKSFVANPLPGSPRLNRLGLHRARVAAAAARRCAALAKTLAPADRESFDRDGFVIHENRLPPETFEAARREVFDAPLPAREMRPGQTVTRMISLTNRMRPRLPQTILAARDPGLRALTCYVAGHGGGQAQFVQTAMAEPSSGGEDPQSARHSDTFHSTAKFRLFLHDVGDEDGPSNARLPPPDARAAGVRARAEPRRPRGEALPPLLRLVPHHAAGPPRLGLRPHATDLGSGKHARRRGRLRLSQPRAQRPRDRQDADPRPPAPQPLRPWNGLDVQSLPDVRGNQIDLFMRCSGWKSRRTCKAHIWKDVGEVKADAPASI